VLQQPGIDMGPLSAGRTGGEDRVPGAQIATIPDEEWAQAEQAARRADRVLSGAQGQSLRLSVQGLERLQGYRTAARHGAGTVKVYLDGVEQPSGWSVDTTTGLVTFGTAPTLNLEVTADFEFDVRCGSIPTTWR
jgi:uncharacterized protein (TIGR02217 family)